MNTARRQDPPVSRVPVTLRSGTGRIAEPRPSAKDIVDRAEAMREAGEHQRRDQPWLFGGW
jgi:hypothetical protein